MLTATPSHIVYTERGPHCITASYGLLTLTVSHSQIENKRRRVIGYDLSKIYVEVSLVVSKPGVYAGPNDWDLLTCRFDTDATDAAMELQRDTTDLTVALGCIINAPTPGQLCAALLHMIELLKKKDPQGSLR